MDEITIAASKCKRKSKYSKLYGMIFAEAIYNIWLQRNQQVFEGGHKHPEHTVDLILFNVACRILDDMKKRMLLYPIVRRIGVCNPLIFGYQ